MPTPGRNRNRRDDDEVAPSDGPEGGRQVIELAWAGANHYNPPVTWKASACVESGQPATPHPLPGRLTARKGLDTVVAALLTECLV